MKSDILFNEDEFASIENESCNIKDSQKYHRYILVNTNKQINKKTNDKTITYYGENIQIVILFYVFLVLNTIGCVGLITKSPIVSIVLMSIFLPIVEIFLTHMLMNSNFQKKSLRPIY